MDTNKLALLTHNVRRYLNGYLYIHWNQHRLKEQAARRAVQEMEKIETELTSLGVTNKQKQQLINYGEVAISVLWTEISDAALKSVFSFVFDEKL
jgi:hypothetical protein